MSSDDEDVWRPPKRNQFQRPDSAGAKNGKLSPTFPSEMSLNSGVASPPAEAPVKNGSSRTLQRAQSNLSTGSGSPRSLDRGSSKVAALHAKLGPRGPRSSAPSTDRADPKAEAKKDSRGGSASPRNGPRSSARPMPQGSLTAKKESFKEASEETVANGLRRKAAEVVRQAPKKIQRIHGKAEELCTEAFKRYTAAQENYVEVMRVMADEYAKVCVMRAESAPTATFNERFAQLLQDYRTMLRFETGGVQEHANLVGSTADLLHKEVHARLVDIALALLNGEQAPSGTIRLSERTWVDDVFGLVIQRWGQAHKAAKTHVKALERFANLTLNTVHVPLVVLAEVCGVAFTAGSLCPLRRIFRQPLDVPEIRYSLEAAAAELQFPLDPHLANTQGVYALGSDGRVYALHTAGLIPMQYSVAFLNNLDLAATKLDPERLAALLHGQLDHVAIEAVAMARSGSNAAQVSKALHRHGLRVQHLNLLHAYLSRQEASREATLGATPDPNLTAALAACVAELLARVIKVVLREVWAERIAAAGLPLDEMATEMAVYAYQLVSLLVVEGQSSRPTQEHQLYATIAKLSYKLFPKDQRSKGRDLLWDEQLVSRGQVARRVAHMTGLIFSDNVIIASTGHGTGEAASTSGVLTGRLVRGIRLKPRDMWTDVHRGKHQEVMKRLVGQIKAARSTDRLDHAYYVTLHLADVFHVAHGRLGVNRKPSDLFEQFVWQRRRSSVAAAKARKAAGDDENEDPVHAVRDVDLLRVLAMQGVYHHAAHGNRSPVPKEEAPPRNGAPSKAQSSKGFFKDANQGSERFAQDTDTTHADAVSALSKYMDASIAATKAASVERVEDVTEDGGSDSFMVATVQTVADRSRVLSQAAQALRGDRMMLGYCEQTLNALDRLRRQKKALDVKQAIALWHDLYDAMVAIQFHVDPRGAVAAAQRKLEFEEQLFGPESAEAAAVRNDLGTVHMRLGELNEGRLHFQIGFDYLAKMQPNSAGAFTTANNLGYTHFRMADRLVDPALKKRRGILLKIKLPDTALLQLQKAEKCFAYVLDRREYALPKTLADVLSNQASVYTYRAQYALAMKLYEEALAVSRGLFSDDHEYRANVIRNMRACERRMKNNAALWITTLCRRFKARQHLRLLQSGAKHAELFQRLGRAFRARQLLSELRERRRMRRIGDVAGLHAGGVFRGGAFGIHDDDAVDEELLYAAETGQAGGLMPDLTGARVQAKVQGGDFAATRNALPPDTVDYDTPLGKAGGHFGAYGTDLPLLPGQGAPPGGAVGVGQNRRRRSSVAMPGMVRESGADYDAGPRVMQDLEAAKMLQKLGRGALTRTMLRKLWKFRNKKKLRR